MKLRDISKIILAAFYRAAYLLHHGICLRPDTSLSQELGQTKLIVVGSYHSGGAGKTPFCLWLAKRLAPRRVAILCHTYAYDEIEMYRETVDSNFVEVVGTSNRHRTVKEILRQPTRPDFIICDDGFEDTRLTGAVYIIMKGDKPPKHLRELWPAGNCRSLEQDHPLDRRTLVLKENEISFSIESIRNDNGDSIFSTQSNYRQVNTFCGIGDPQRFIWDVQSLGIAISRSYILKDHDRHFSARLSKVIQENPNDAFIITHKDACRLDSELRNRPNIFTARQMVCVNLPAVLKIEQAISA